MQSGIPRGVDVMFGAAADYAHHRIFESAGAKLKRRPLWSRKSNQTRPRVMDALPRIFCTTRISPPAPSLSTRANASERQVGARRPST